jgi:drug/metabolite transporter (DMT)-like permease
MGEMAMSRRDAVVMFLVCLAWALNTLASSILIVRYQVPPLFYALVRFGLAAVLLLGYLRPLPRPGVRMLLAGVLLGGGHFGLMFLGLRTVSASGAAIILQLIIPTTTLLSMLLLGERLSLQRGLGIAVAFIGVLVVLVNGAEQAGSLALGDGVGQLWLLASVLSISLGTVLLKGVETSPPLRIQAWVALTSALPLGLGSWAMEQHQVAHAWAAGWVFALAMLFSVVVVTLLATSAFYGLIQRYEGNLIASLVLMMPIQTVALGVLVNGDRLDLTTVAGAALTIAGVLAILRARNAPTHKAILPVRPALP